MPAERRLGLIEATARALARHGSAGVSVRTIAAEADVSPGLVAHHFDGVEALMADTYRHHARLNAVALGDAVAAAPDDPQSRLRAYIEGYFRPPVLDVERLGSWLALLGLTRSMPSVAEAHRKAYAAVRLVLSGLLSACGVDGDLDGHAMTAQALIEGLWLQLTFDHSDAAVERVRQEAERCILRRFA